MTFQVLIQSHIDFMTETDETYNFTCTLPVPGSEIPVGADVIKPKKDRIE